MSDEELSDWKETDQAVKLLGHKIFYNPADGLFHYFYGDGTEGEPLDAGCAECVAKLRALCEEDFGVPN
jgi:hypothetical protein